MGVHEMVKPIIAELSSSRTGFSECQTRGDAGEGLLDAGLALEPSNVADDLLDVLGSYVLNLRHVTELPVMGTDAVRGR